MYFDAADAVVLGFPALLLRPTANLLIGVFAGVLVSDVTQLFLDLANGGVEGAQFFADGGAGRGRGGEFVVLDHEFIEMGLEFVATIAFVPTLRAVQARLALSR